MGANQKNKILEDNGDWVIVDISTKTHPCATMATDTVAFNSHKGSRIFAIIGRESYIRARYNKKLDNGLVKQFYFHRDVIQSQDGMEIDHIRHGTKEFIDNRISNLRVVTSSQNAQNRSIQKNNSSGITGISWHKRIGKWRSYIIINSKEKHLGYFDNIDFAIGARQQAEREYFGEYAYNANK